MVHIIWSISYGPVTPDRCSDLNKNCLISTDPFGPNRIIDRVIIFMFRIGKGNGKFYPNISSDFDMNECPAFWRNRKVKINLLNMKDEEYMKNIRISAFIAIGMDLLVGIGSFIIIWRYTNLRKMWSVSGGGFGKLKFFIMKILLAFGMPIVDTVLGKRILFPKFYRSTWVIYNNNHFFRRIVLWTTGIEITPRPYEPIGD